MTNTVRLADKSLAPANAISGSAASMRTSQVSRRPLGWLCPGGDGAPGPAGEPAGSGMWLLIQLGMPRDTLFGGVVGVRLLSGEGIVRVGIAATGSKRIWRITWASRRTSAL